MTDEIRIPNIENYIMEIINGELILTPKKQRITEEELYIIPITNSKIEKCTIKKDNEIISTGETYRGILIDIWKSTPVQKILQTTTYNFKLTNENGKKGYIWCDSIQMSFQNKDAHSAFKEILNMIKVNNLSIELSIKLETGRTIYYKKDYLV
jgi:hypothetical protein